MFGDFLTAFRGLHKGKDTEVSKHITLELNQTISKNSILKKKKSFNYLKPE